MSYEDQENSAFGGAPVELYLFNRNDRTFWGYTSADEQYVIGTQTYFPESMKRGKIEKSMDVRRNNMTVTVPVSNDFVQQFIQSPPTDKITLSVFAFHLTDVANEIVLIWIGRVINVNFKESTVDIRCEPLDTSFKRPTLRRVYGPSCPHELYGAECTVDPVLFVVPATITALDGLSLTAPEFATKPDGYFAGGPVDILFEGNFSRRFITSHTGDTVFVNLPMNGVDVGSTVNAFPGCPHNTSVCHTRFGNILNYGGQPFWTKKNPMSGTPIF